MGCLPYIDFISVNIVALEALSDSCIISRYSDLILFSVALSNTTPL